MSASASAQRPEESKANEKAIIELTRRMSRFWDAGDAVGYAEQFGEHSDYVAFDGTWLHGRQANAAHHSKLFQTVLKSSRLVFEEPTIVRFISGDLAIMHAKGSVLMPWQDHVTAKRRSIQTYVVCRGADGRWLIEAFHNTRDRPRTLPRGIALRLILIAMRLRSYLRLGYPHQPVGRPT